ncbi:MAG: hypothetical protein KA771_08305 [Spirochaetales bacterium]|nr:hypothetical protein [Spirochaetales bacterium]
MKINRKGSIIVFLCVLIVGSGVTLFLNNCSNPLTSDSSGDSTGGENIPVTGVSLNKNTITLAVPKSEQLVATVSPADASNKTII